MNELFVGSQGNAFVDITSEAFGGNVSSMGTPNQAKQMPWVPFLKLADLNNDGLINSADLLLFLGAFGTYCVGQAP
jgi:hypothetical protein